MCALVLAVCVSGGGWCAEAVGHWASAEAVREVLAGERTTADAAWWGFDEADATGALQGALDSGAKKVVVPYMGKPWIVRPLQLASHQEVVFAPGVVVLAKAGEFKGKGDSLFTGKNLSDVTLRGYGATLRMRKEDYQGAAYEEAEWRMVFDFMSCRRVTVLGLRLENSGGDGIYLGVSGDGPPYCEDVVVRDVVCDGHHRQGISVVSAVNLLIENCVLSNTAGTEPEAGIDFEPNQPNERLENCVVRNCRMENNSGAGILVYPKHLSRGERAGVDSVRGVLRCGWEGRGAGGGRGAGRGSRGAYRVRGLHGGGRGEGGGVRV